MKEAKDWQADEGGKSVDKQSIEQRVKRLKQFAEQETSPSIAEAYKQSAEILSTALEQAERIVLAAEEKGNRMAMLESARIVAEAKQTAQQITREAGEKDLGAYVKLGGTPKSGKLTEDSYDQVDDLFLQIRRLLTKTSTLDQAATARELKRVVNELEYWVDSLVIDSLKLRSLESRIQKTTEMAKKLRLELNEK